MPNSNVPIASLSNSDLSVSFLNKLFGEKWWTFDLTEPTGWAGVIYDMFQVLNELAFFTLAFMYILTIASGIVGTAHEGKPLGQKFHSFWVPLRMTLAVGFLAPIKHGLCLFQVLLLITLGFSIDYANKLWETFIDGTIEISTMDPSIVNRKEEALNISRTILSNTAYINYIIAEYPPEEGQIVKYTEGWEEHKQKRRSTVSGGYEGGSVSGEADKYSHTRALGLAFNNPRISPSWFSNFFGNLKYLCQLIWVHFMLIV